MIKAAIFDADGTLLMSSQMWDNLGERFLLSKGVTPKPDLNERIRSLSFEQGAAFLQREYLADTTETEIISGIKSMIDSFYRYEVKAADGALELLSLLSTLGVSMCVATAGDAELAGAAFNRLFPKRFFTDILTCSEYAPKSTPEIYLAAAEKLRSKPSETIVFEDSLHAVLTAKKAGFVTAAVRDTSEPEQEALKKTADYYNATLFGYVKDFPLIKKQT